MRRELFIITTLFLMLFLTACTSSSGTLKPNQNNIIVDIINNANFNIYGVEINVYKNQHLVSTQGTINADGSKVKKGESLQFEFINQDFPLTDDATLELFVLDHNKKKTPLKSGVTIKLTNSKKYSIEISGNSITNANLNRTK